MKLSKNHEVKVATEEEQKVVVADAPLMGANVNEDLPLENAADDKNGEAEEEKENDDQDGEKDGKHDARLEAATPHANAAKDLFGKRRELLSQLNELDDKLNKHREVLQALDPKARHSAYADDGELRKYLKPEKEEKKKKRKKKLEAAVETEVVEGLLKVATLLDTNGDLEGMTYVENLLSLFTMKEAKKEEKKGDVPLYDVATIEKEKRDYPKVEEPAPTLSTRHCPDHRGVNLMRIADNSYQCQLDHRVYNWNQGFTDDEGNKYKAAPIRSVDFPETSSKLFENRQMALSKRQK